MTPIEKAETALNHRIVRLQGTLREGKSETAQRFVVQSVIVCIGIGETLADYVKTIGQFARERHGEIKEGQAALTVQHATLLKSGNELLEQLRAKPTDRTLRKEIDEVQRSMAAIQKTLRRGANSLQRDVAPSTAMIDPFAMSIKRLCEADQLDGLKRVIKLFVGHVGDLYLAQPTLESKISIGAAAWEASAVAQIDAATDFHEAFAHAGYQAILALNTMMLAVSQTPPRTAEEAIQRANQSAEERLKAITARFAGA